MAQKIKIKWANIYHMLIYAIDELEHMKIGRVDTEKCKSLDDLFASLMCKSIELLYENNYLSEYNKVKRNTDKPHGNILIQESYSSGSLASGKMSCEYFELNINSVCNIAIKSAINCLLIHGKNISKHRIGYLTTVIDDLHIVKDIEASDIDYDDIDYKDLPEWYKPAILVSKLIVNQLLSRDKNGASKLFRLEDTDRLKYIFEKFVRNFYRLEYTKGKTSHPVYKLSARQNRLDMLIENTSNALIIDTKWYESANYRSNRTNNEREVTDYIISYKEHESSTGLTRKETFGVVLYARTDENEKVLIKEEVRSLGRDYGYCTICENTLNMDQDFNSIKNDLIDLANDLLNRHQINTQK